MDAVEGVEAEPVDSLLRYASMRDMTPSESAKTPRRTPAAIASTMWAGVNFSETERMVRLTQTTIVAPVTAPDTNQNIRRIMTAALRQCYGRSSLPSR
jgi:hypothetical protein